MAFDANPVEELIEAVEQPYDVQRVNVGVEELHGLVALRDRQENTAGALAGVAEDLITVGNIHEARETEGVVRAETAVTAGTYYSGVASAETHARLADDANTGAHSAAAVSQDAAAAAEGLRETVRVRQTVTEQQERFVLLQKEVAQRAVAAVEDKTKPDVIAEMRVMAAAAKKEYIGHDLEAQLHASAAIPGGPKI